jgi:hypothetical protein
MTRIVHRSFRVLAMVSLTSALACDEAGEGTDDEGYDCPDGKCDTPGGTMKEQCLARQSEVLSSSQRGFLPDAIRWAAADVEGVNTKSRDSRGQEYTEYFAIVDLMGAKKGIDLGRPLSEEEGDVSKSALCLDGQTDENCAATVTEEQMIAWEDDPTAIAGACVFTAWHNDVPGPLPACEDGECGPEDALYGLPFTEEFFRMKIFFNGNSAANDLVKKCYDGKAPAPKSWSNTKDPLTEPFFRGCMQVQGIFGTGWRRSDPSVCAVVNRLDECGCTVPGLTRETLPDGIIPAQPDKDGNITLRGFRLGSWDDPEALPPGCRYLETGDDSHVLVACDLTATDVRDNLADVKEVCRRTYGPNVVVHVPLPKDAITCKPPKTSAAKSCGMTPWNIGRENG